MFVSQSVNWLTSLLIFGQNRDISLPEWDIFLKIFGDIPGMFLHHFKIILNFLYVCQSVSWLTSLLKLGQNRDISCPGWDIFLKFSVDIPEMFVHFYQIMTNFFYVCQSVSWLTYLLELGQNRDISCPGWVIFLIFL